MLLAWRSVQRDWHCLLSAWSPPEGCCPVLCWCATAVVQSCTTQLFTASRLVSHAVVLHFAPGLRNTDSSGMRAQYLQPDPDCINVLHFLSQCMSAILISRLAGPRSQSTCMPKEIPV